MVNMLLVLVWTSGKLLIVYPIVWRYVNCLFMDYPGMPALLSPAICFDGNKGLRSATLKVNAGGGGGGGGGELIKVCRKAPYIFNIFLNDLFYFVKQGNINNYADDNSISVSHKKLTLLSRQLDRQHQRSQSSSPTAETKMWVTHRPSRVQISEPMCTTSATLWPLAK